MSFSAPDRTTGDIAALRAFAPTLILLVISLLINYVDRGNLALAAPLLAIGFSLAAISLVGCAFAGEHTYLGWLIACALGSGAANAGTFAFAQTLAGPHAAGRWVGLENGIANMAGVVGPRSLASSLTGQAISSPPLRSPPSSR